MFRKIKNNRNSITIENSSYFQTGNSFELKFTPVLTNRLDLRHNVLTSSQSKGVPSTLAIMLSMVETTVHESSLISKATGLAYLLALDDTLAPNSGEELITSVAPD